MRVLVVGGGGREHALVWKLAQSPKVERIYCAPGNPGIAALAECVPVAADDLAALRAFAVANKVDLTVVGPEKPLVDGIADYFAEQGLRVFGPSAAAARLEGSKVYAKQLMAKYIIPTARFRVFTDSAEAQEYVRKIGGPVVVKADGLAAGKGVIVAADTEEALAAVRDIMDNQVFGAAGRQVVIEERLIGEEATVLAFTDGYTVVPMVAAQDHKRIFAGDRGPNTGGMGAYAPAPVITLELERRVVTEILEPVLRALRQEGIIYTGCLYAGLMITDDGPKVIEFNARFGDPEAQVVLPLLASDLVTVMEACLDGRLKDCEVKWRHGAAVCVVLAAAGYPGSYTKGDVITGLDTVDDPAAIVFHAGTAWRDGRIVTNGGRVLGITGLGSDIRSAANKAYSIVEKIDFAGKQYRPDIAWRVLQRAASR